MRSVRNLRPPRGVVGVAVAAVLVAGVLVAVVPDGGDDVTTVPEPTSTTGRPPSTTGAETTTSTAADPTTSTGAPPVTAVPPSSAAPTTATPAPTTAAPAPTAPPPPALEQIRLRLQPVLSLGGAVAMVARPGTGELWIASKGGRVVALRGGGAVDVVNLTGEVTTGGEQGLLGLAFDPSGTRLVLSFTDALGDTRLDEFTVDGNGTVVPGTRRTVFTEDQPYANHNGGHLVLGPDGYLYFGLGDGGSGGDPENRAQNPATRLGKLLRLDPTTYAVQIWALGLRNPWRFSFDRATGDLWLGDVGQNQWEEIDRVPLSALAGADFAWDRMEGTHSFQGGQPEPGDIVPVHEYSHARGCSVTGGHRYRGTAIPSLAGIYLYGDYCEGLVRGIRLDAAGGLAEEGSLGLSVPQLASFGEDAAGELYVLSLGGQVSRIVAG